MRPTLLPVLLLILFAPPASAVDDSQIRGLVEALITWDYAAVVDVHAHSFSSADNEATLNDMLDDARSKLGGDVVVGDLRETSPGRYTCELGGSSGSAQLVFGIVERSGDVVFKHWQITYSE